MLYIPCLFVPRCTQLTRRPERRVGFLRSAKLVQSCDRLSFESGRGSRCVCCVSELQACRPGVGFVSSFSTGLLSLESTDRGRKTVWLSIQNTGFLEDVAVGKSHSLRSKKILPTWLGYWKTVFVCSGCHNKTPQTGWLTQQLFSQFWKLEVHAQYVPRFDYF